MDGLSRLVEREKELEKNYPKFLSSLDVSRTVTLRQIIEEPETALIKLNAQWANPKKLIGRIRNSTDFLNNVPVQGEVVGFDGLPLIFFQTTDEREDREEFEKYLAWKGKNFPFMVQYLHTHTNFIGILRNNDLEFGKTVCPLVSFTSRGRQYMSWDENGVPWEHSPMIIGYRVPNYSFILGVSEDVATDYWARVITHDLGHGVLPEVGTRETLHNVTMLYSMGIKQQEISERTEWENFVHRECADPFYFLESDYLTGRANNGNLSPSKREYLKDVMSWNDDFDDIRRDLWGISWNATLEQAKKQVVKVINEMVRDGFQRYH